MKKTKKEVRETMLALASMAKAADERGDVVLRRAYSTDWYNYATPSQAKRAPAYLRWVGR